MKLNKKIIGTGLVVAAGALIAWSYFKPKPPEYKTEKARRGLIVQEVAETGSIKKGDEIKLNFKNSGTVLAVDVAKGDKAAAGQILARLDDRQLKLQLEQARASLDLYNLQLAKLKKGAGSEDVAIVKSQEQAAKTALEGARQSLNDAQTGAAQKLESAYKTAADALASAYTKAYNGYTFSELLQRTYFSPRDPDSIAVWETVQKTSVAIAQIKSFSDKAAANGNNEGLDGIFISAETPLGQAESYLRSIRAMCEKEQWRDVVSQTYKDTLDAHIGYLAAARTALNAAVQSVALQKNTNRAAVNAAAAAVDAAAAALKTAQDQSAKITANPRSEDVGVLESQVSQARAQVELLELQIADSRMAAPAAGTVVSVNIRAGETALPQTAGGAIVLLPADPFVVEADIYEEEAVKIKIGDPAQITVAALPDQLFEGRITSVDPAGKLVNGVVYYPVKIAFNEIPAEAKPDMTADVVIKTAQSENAILISEAALQKKKDGAGYFVQILENGRIREAKAVPGIRSKGIVEIVSEINEGDEIVIP